MIHGEFTVVSPTDGLELRVQRWLPEEPVTTIVQIAHGLAEYSDRYARFAEALVAAGFGVYAHDHRGHGSSVGGDVALGDFGAAGWDALVSDVVAVRERIGDDFPDVPVFLFGHSMGSFASQQVILDHADRYVGVVLSGSTSLDLLAQGMAESGAADLTAFNAGFEPRTGYEWLSRDEAEVDLYVADPMCGFDLAESTVPSLFSYAARLADPAALAAIGADLPILIHSGSDDPLAGQGQLVEVLGQRYRDAGAADVTVVVHPGARHEILNETNRDEVTTGIVDWLDAHR